MQASISEFEALSLARQIAFTVLANMADDNPASLENEVDVQLVKKYLLLFSSAISANDEFNRPLVQEAKQSEATPSQLSIQTY